MKHLWRALGFLRRYWTLTAIAFVSLLISTGVNLAIPGLTRTIIDSGIASNRLDIVITTAVGIVIVAISGAVFSFLQGILSARIAQSIAYDLRNQLYAKIHALSFSYHDRAQTGQLLTRATSDVELVQMFVGTAFIQFLSGLLMMVEFSGSTTARGADLALGYSFDPNSMSVSREPLGVPPLELTHVAEFFIGPILGLRFGT